MCIRSSTCSGSSPITTPAIDIILQGSFVVIILCIGKPYYL